MAGGVGGLVYSVRGAGAQPSYNLYNSRGDVVAQTNGTGVFTWQASYEAFGTRTGESGLNRERHRANTKDEDPTGLLNEGMRYRDLETGVWLTRDPAGFVDGPNLYAYVRQNPWTAFDPHGLRTKAPNVRWRDVRGSTVTPDHPLVTKRSPNLDREKYGDGVYIDDNGYADFSPYARKLTPEGDTRIPFDPGQLKGNSHMDHDIGLARKKLKDQMGYTDELIAKLEKDHTWHHVEGGQRMELVPTDLHKAYFHFGGTSDIKRGNWFTGALCFVAGMFNPLSNTLEAAQSQGDVASALQSDVTDNLTPDMIAIPAAVGQAAADYAEKKVNTARRLNNYTNSQVPIERAMGQLSVQMYMLENDGEFPPGYRP